jgi:hypothetical protein
MHWLSTNYQWVVAVVAMPIVLLLLKRWADSPKKTAGAAPTQAALSAEGFTVSNSPVVGGSGNIQNINAPTTVVHVHAERTEPARPTLTIEIEQVCFGGAEDFVGKDLSDFRVDRYIFAYLWMVNTESVVTTLKQMSLSYSTGGEKVVAFPVSDLSQWFQRIRSEEPGLGFETRTVRHAHKTLTPFPLEPLQQGIPLKGWVCFKASGVLGLGGDEGSIELCVEDSFGKEYCVQKSAPFGCKGVMVDHLDEWRHL